MTGINDLHATKAYKCQQVGECRAAKIASLYCRIPTKEAIESLRKDESTTPSGSPHYAQTLKILMLKRNGTRSAKTQSVNR